MGSIGSGKNKGLSGLGRFPARGSRGPERVAINAFGSSSYQFAGTAHRVDRVRVRQGVAFQELEEPTPRSVPWRRRRMSHFRQTWSTA